KKRVPGPNRPRRGRGLPLRCGSPVETRQNAATFFSEEWPHGWRLGCSGNRRQTSARPHSIPGAFSADDYPSWNVVMALTPSREILPNYGMGLITYVWDELDRTDQEMEKLAESLCQLSQMR